MVKQPNERDLDILQVTINNRCNLTCPHCYLNVAGAGYMGEETIEQIFADPPTTVAIVGMEPFFDARSTAIVRQIAKLGKATNTFVSVITNGLGLKLMRRSSEDELPDLIDISLDGGPRHYASSRGSGRNHFPQILKNVGALRCDTSCINILHTLYAENASPERIADMIDGGAMVSPRGEQYFSPYILPNIMGGQREATSGRLELGSLLETLRGTSRFMEHSRAFFFVGMYNAEAFGLSIPELRALVESHGLTRKSRIDAGVPHLNGGLRITFDGYALRPDYTIHTSLYQKYRVPIGSRRLADIYEEFKALPPVSKALAQHVP